MTTLGGPLQMSFDEPEGARESVVVEQKKLESDFLDLRRELASLKSAYVSLRQDHEILTRALVRNQPAKAVGVQENRGKPGERRGASRRRTRLDSCKVLNRDFIWIGECSIFDQSESGCRLKNLNFELPAKDFLMIRDTDGLLLYVNRRWTQGSEVGVQIVRCVARLDSAYPRDKIRLAFAKSKAAFAPIRALI